MKKGSFSMKNINEPKKQIIYDTDRDRYYLKEKDKNKLYETNKFGKKKATINIPQTGFAKYNERLTNSIDKLNFNIDDSLYHPQSLRFEGYSQFPRPLILPFSNVTSIKLQKNIIDNLKKTHSFFTTHKNKKILEKKLNKGLTFYSGKINNLENKRNKQKVLNKIDEALSFDEKNKEKFNEHQKNALKHLKNKLLSNSTNMIFGRKLKRPDSKFILRFKINYNIFFNNPIKNNKLKRNENEKDNKFYFEELYNTLNKKTVKQSKNSSSDRNMIEIEDYSNKAKNKDSSPNKKPFINETNTTYYNENKNLNYKTRNIKEITNQFKKNIFNSKKTESDISKDNSTKEGFYKSLSKWTNSKNSMEYVYKEKDKDKDINDILFQENENEKTNNNIYISQNYNSRNYVENKKDNVRTSSDLFRKCFEEKKLLKGFIKAKKKEGQFRKYMPKIKSTINIYKKEWEMEKLVNPIRFKIEEENELKKIKMMKEKLDKEREIISFRLKNFTKNKKSSPLNKST